MVSEGTNFTFPLPTDGFVFQPSSDIPGFAPVNITINPSVNSVLLVGNQSLLPSRANNLGSFPLLAGQDNTIELLLPVNPIFLVDPQAPTPANAVFTGKLVTIKGGFISNVFPLRAGNTGDVTFTFSGGPFVEIGRAHV